MVSYQKLWSLCCSQAIYIVIPSPFQAASLYVYIRVEMLLYSFPSYWPHFSTDFFCFSPNMGVGGHHGSFRRLGPSWELLFNGMGVYSLWSCCILWSHPPCMEWVFQSQFAHFEEIPAFLSSLSEFNSFGDLNSAWNGLNQNYMADLQNT